MAKPVLTIDKARGANLHNSGHCVLILPGQELSKNIKKNHVTVTRKAGALAVDVLSAKADQFRTGWVLFIKTKEVPKHAYGDSEEVTVTVTNPDTAETSDPVDVEVVYFDDQ